MRVGLRVLLLRRLSLPLISVTNVKIVITYCYKNYSVGYSIRKHYIGCFYRTKNIKVSMKLFVTDYYVLNVRGKNKLRLYGFVAPEDPWHGLITNYEYAVNEYTLCKI